VDGSAEALVDTAWSGVVLQNGSKEAHELVAVKLRDHNILRAAPLHEPHGDQVGLTDKLHKIRRLLRSQVVFARVFHELPVRFPGKRAEAGSETLEHRVRLPQRPFTAGIDPARLISVHRSRGRGRG